MPVSFKTRAPGSFKRLLGGAPTNVFSEGKNEAVAVSHYKFALLIDAIFRTIENVSTAAAQLCGQGVNAAYVEVGVISPLSSVSFHMRLIGTAEEHLNVIARHDSEEGRRENKNAFLPRTPEAGALEAGKSAAQTGRATHARHSGPRDDRREANLA